MPKFQPILDRALFNKGGEKSLQQLLPNALSKQQLSDIPDDRYLAEMAKCIFRSGFVWKIVENKWPGFEAAFKQFDISDVLYLSDEHLDTLAQDTTIIRHRKKIAAVRDNAVFIDGIRQDHSSFGQFIADWPAHDITGLWQLLKKRGSRLGGHSGPYFLRFMGKDTFLFSKDVVTVLVSLDIVIKEPTAKRDLLKVQDQFNQWQQETGLQYGQLSRIMAASIRSD